MSAALVNEIAHAAPGRVYLLHIDGTRENPVFGMLDDSVVRVPVLPSDFESFVRDDVAGFDAHPGPYWHHAVGRRLFDVLASRN